MDDIAIEKTKSAFLIRIGERWVSLIFLIHNKYFNFSCI